MHHAERAVLDQFLAEIRTLKVHRAAGKASLKKPVLLVVVVSSFSRDRFAENRIRYMDVEADFSLLFSTATGRRTSLVEPFYRMRTERFWHLKLERSWPSTGALPSKSILTSPGSWAELDGALFGVLRASESARDQAISELTKAWLDEEQASAVRAALAAPGSV